MGIIVNYYLVAIRYLSRNKVFSFINMSGLSLGLAVAMLMILYSKDEWSYDAFHKDLNSTYLVTIDVRHPDGSSEAKMGVTGLPHGPRFQATIPEIESYVRMAKTYKDVKLGDQVLNQSVMFTDSNFFSFFDFKLLQGNASTVLKADQVVISEDLAITHFGSQDPINRVFYFDFDGVFKPFTVAGVAKRCPQNSSIQFDVLLPFPKMELNNDQWVEIGYNTFVKLAQGSHVEAVNMKMQQVFEKESKEVMDKVRGSGFDQTFYHYLQPLKEIHLSQDFVAEGGLVNGSNPMYSYVLSGIAFFILAIACINFINLTVARSVKRAREIGIRKVVGGGRTQLIAQFLGESFLLSCFSFAAALIMVWLFLPTFNQLVNKALSFTYLLDAALIISYVALWLITALLAGFYPALILSGYSPVQTLYNQFRLLGRNYLQKGLIVFQFALASLMIVGTATIYLQFDYLTTKDLGYSPDHLIKVSKRNLKAKEVELFRNELLKDPHLISVSPHVNTMDIAKINGDSIRNFSVEVVDDQFLNLMKIQLTHGRNFSGEFPADSSTAVLVNEAFVKMAGWKNPLGEELNYWIAKPTPERRKVIGIVKNYHFKSVKQIIEPQVFILNRGLADRNSEFLIKIAPGSEASSLSTIEKAFKTLFPMMPFTYQFYDEMNRRNFESESRWKQVMLWGAILTVFVSGIGLFGLSMLNAERRFKEIGIRKVLGASVKGIVLMLSKDIVVLIVLALIAAMPIAYFVGKSWLSNYPYRTDVGPGIFILTGLLVSLVALITVSYQSVKAGMTNPVEALRRE